MIPERLVVRRLLGMAFVLVAACTRPLKLSDAIAPAGESPLHAILSIMMRNWHGPQAYLTDSTVAPPHLVPAQFIEGYWVDSAREGFTVALRDLFEHGAQVQPIDAGSVAGLPLQLLHGRTTAQANGPTVGPWYVQVSRVGFNSDSTFAAIYHSYYCGMRCAGASISLYARRPGRRWTFWSSKLLWIS